MDLKFQKMLSTRGKKDFINKDKNLLVRSQIVKNMSGFGRIRRASKNKTPYTNSFKNYDKKLKSKFLTIKKVPKQTNDKNKFKFVLKKQPPLSKFSKYSKKSKSKKTENKIKIRIKDENSDINSVYSFKDEQKEYIKNIQHNLKAKEVEINPIKLILQKNLRIMTTRVK